HLLGEWPSTAICGNDILSSVLYSASSVSLKAGKLMPVPLLLVAVVLYFFRFIYEEVVTAIPLNGGSYNGLLNTTSKRTASVAACLGILSYVATGVVSSTSGVNYLRQQVDIPLVGSVVALLFAFAVLAFMGITESSRVAMAMFFHHVLVLSVVLVSCIVYGVQHTHVFRDNMHSEFPEVDFAGSMLHGNVFTSIFFGFGASMLGITGFETSAQFVEEQVPGVFRKTLRNMWGFASFFNFTLAIGILAALPMEEIYASSEALLAQTAFVTAGKWLEVWVCIDAFVVLAGAVLTSYVGICGLVRRLSNDRVLPAFLAKTNKLRGTTHYIIFSYFLLSSSLVI
uniref:Amino acid permease/ SLC12A domain-containing protein n=1 Tax=Globisporangium ultimum (strain ATCC 200006 / CBS 805.95 / DAOM BR144) TaxID=431595 RepID=K3XDI7_GLOUD